jgi:adenine phosphoribosyltransferase
LLTGWGAGFIPVRKPGKLPAATFSKSYELEYGNDSLEIHCDALSPEDIGLVHDDLIATGGTSIAVLELIKYFNVTSVFINFIVELSFLKGRDRFAPEYDIYSLIKF